MDELVSPFDDSKCEPHGLAPRLVSLKGKRLTLLSISKPKSAEFLDALENVLRDRYGAEVTRAHKPTFTTPAPTSVFDSVVSSSDAVIEALAD